LKELMAERVPTVFTFYGCIRRRQPLLPRQFDGIERRADRQDLRAHAPDYLRGLLDAFDGSFGPLVAQAQEDA
jgi:hypothetical protein